MSKKTKKYSQSNLFEFRPKSDITENEIIELLALIRIGISGDLLDKASDQLKKHFVEIKKAA
jgi:hypothetical protein